MGMQPAMSLTWPKYWLRYRAPVHSVNRSRQTIKARLSTFRVLHFQLHCCYLLSEASRFEHSRIGLFQSRWCKFCFNVQSRRAIAGKHHGAFLKIQGTGR